MELLYCFSIVAIILGGSLGLAALFDRVLDRLFTKLNIWYKIYKKIDPIIEVDQDFIERQLEYHRFCVQGPTIEPRKKNFFTLAVSPNGYTLSCWMDPKSLTHIVDRLTWIQENTVHAVSIDLDRDFGHGRPTTLRIYFSNDDDAMAFKLRWS